MLQVNVYVAAEPANFCGGIWFWRESQQLAQFYSLENDSSLSHEYSGLYKKQRPLTQIESGVRALSWAVSIDLNCA